MIRRLILVGMVAGFLGCAKSPETNDLETAGPETKTESAAPETSEKKVDPAPIMTWQDLTSRPLPNPTTSIKYNELPTGVVDVWLPDGEGPHAVVLMIHGGCWQKSIADRSLMNYAAEHLRKQGMAVWNIEYRGVDEPGGGYPGTYEDVVQAGNALSQQASELNLDMGRVAGFGHSAGGHLITWYAGSINLPGNTRIKGRRDIDLKGVINSGGLADLVISEPATLTSCLADIRPSLTGAATEARPDPYADTSSDRLLPTGVMTHIVNGKRDKIAPEDLGIAYSKKVHEGGDPVSTSFVNDEGHVELIAPGTKSFDRQSAILQELLGLK